MTAPHDETRETTAVQVAAERRVLILDGAMGTMLGARKLSEATFRGTRWSNHPSNLSGNYDALVLTQPGVVRGVHAEYLDAGADIVQTNTFRSTAIAQAEYALESAAYELNHEAARLARAAADEWSERTPDRPRFVAGTIGPLRWTPSRSPETDDHEPAGQRAASTTEWTSAAVAAFAEQARALIDGGVDLLLAETVLDVHSLKACLVALDRTFADTGTRVPVIVSVTVTEQGRMLSGHTLTAFWESVAAFRPMGVGVNCAYGARTLRPHVAELARLAPVLVSAHPNAGLPNASGAHEETPEEWGRTLGEWARAGLVNIVGGCCGTTPAHIRAVAESVKGVEPRALAK